MVFFCLVWSFYYLVGLKKDSSKRSYSGINATIDVLKWCKVNIPRVVVLVSGGR